jgi:hypothetical protein
MLLLASFEDRGLEVSKEEGVREVRELRCTS